MRDSKEFHKLANEQIDHEFWGAHQYVATAAYFSALNMPHTASVFSRHAVEERGHAQKFIDYLLDRNLEVTIGPVKEVANDFKSPQDALFDAVEREEFITAKIFALVDQAHHDKDHFASQFITWFVDEQREEENLFSELHEVFQKCKSRMEFETYVKDREHAKSL